MNKLVGAREQRLFWLLLFVTFLKGWLWAAAFPPFIHADELHHLGYARDVYRSGTLYIEPRGEFTPEEVIALDIVQVSPVSGLRRPVNLSPQRVAELSQLYQLLQEPARQPAPEPIAFGPYFARHHPPFYYGVQAVVARLVQPADMFVELAWGRLLGVLLHVAAVALTYLLARELWPERPRFWLAAATLMSFLPMITYIGAVFSNQALEIPLFVAIFWLLLRMVRHGVTWPRAFWLGLALGVGLLTKVSLLVTIPLIILVAIYDGWQRRTLSLAWVFVVLLPLLIAGPWYYDYIQGSRSSLAGSSEAALGCPALGVYLLELPWGVVVRTLWTESMASFGIRDTFFPNWLYQLTFLALLLAVAGWGRRLAGAWIRRDKTWYWPRERWFGMGLLFLAWLGIHAFMLLIGYLLSCGDVDAYAAASGVTRNPLAFVSGRLVIPGAAAPLSILLLAGWLSLAKGYERWVLPLAGLLLILLNSYALVDRVVGRYYGLQEVWAEDARQVTSLPLTPKQTVWQCVTLPPTELARVDVWLQKAQGNVTGTLDMTMRTADGEIIGQTDTFRLGGQTTFPAYAQFPPQPVTGEVCFEFRGAFAAPVQMWATEEADGLWYDGEEAQRGHLALRLYGTVPWSTMPERLAAASLFVYSAAFYRWLACLYGLTLLVFSTSYGLFLTPPQTQEE